jgi:hypothetical protein
MPQADMKRVVASKDWLPLAKTGKVAAELPTGEAFRAEWIDFARGIRVGNLAPQERITQILKFYLEQRHGTPFVTDRWGRGVYWQWICWLPRVNREAKPISHDVNFGCAKLFISVDKEERVFESGLQVEGGYARAAADASDWVRQRDWDWHRLMKQCAPGTTLDAELRRLLKHEGFVAWIGGKEFNAKNFRSARQLRAAARHHPADEWLGFQLYYPMPEREVRASTGYELVRAVCGVFAEVVPVMNCCMPVRLTSRGG